MNEKHTRVGIGVIIRKDGKVLIGQRLISHGKGTRETPGGHLEFQEHPFDGAKRETLEETGITIKNCQFIGFTNDIHPSEDKHYITIMVLADYDSGELQPMEPDKCAKRERLKREDFPSPRFLCMETLIKS